jgi:hypothetical protein
MDIFAKKEERGTIRKDNKAKEEIKGILKREKVGEVAASNWLNCVEHLGWNF